MICKKCGNQISNEVLFCDFCGAKTEEESCYCGNCGARLDKNDEFCGTCGTPVTSGAPVISGGSKQPQVIDDRNKEKGSPLLIILIVVLAVVVLAGGAAAAYLFLSNNRSDSTEAGTITASTARPDSSSITSNSASGNNNGSSSSSDISGAMAKVTAAPTIAPTAVPVPVFNHAAASSVRGTDTEGGQYSVESVLSNDIMTKWVPQKSTSNGINEWVMISADSLQYVHGINILNGYQKNQEVWNNNNRVRDCTLSFSDGTTRSFTLSDTMDMIRLDFNETIATTYIKLTIRSVYRGVKWNDTAITYMGAF